MWFAACIRNFLDHAEEVGSQESGVGSKGPRMNIAIVGNGRMGKAVAALARARGHTIHTVVDSSDNAGGRALTRDRLAGADVAIEFTQPSAAVTNLERLVELSIPTVTGTTGWTEALPRIAALVVARRGALLHAANFSVGVHLFLRTASGLAQKFRGRQEFEASILEEHHAAKLDAPSGTALLLQRRLAAADPGRSFPITSVREGTVPGTHTLTYEGPHETVTLSHAARNRDAFAAGAIAAAEWLPGKTGIFTFDDLLFGDSA
jgi:4-hydroxy-tetrahydrodipicolinate reductase